MRAQLSRNLLLLEDHCLAGLVLPFFAVPLFFLPDAVVI